MLTLKEPYPFIYNYKSVVIPGLVTFWVISIFSPFGLSVLAIGKRLLFGFAFGLLSSFSVVLVIAEARKLFPEFMQEDNWTVGKEILLFVSVLVTICLFIFLSFVLFNLSSSDPIIVFKQVVLYTSAISIIPIYTSNTAFRNNVQNKPLSLLKA